METAFPMETKFNFHALQTTICLEVKEVDVITVVFSEFSCCVLITFVSCIFSSVVRYMRKANNSIERTPNSTWKQLSRWRRSSIFMHCKLRFVWKSKKSMCCPEVEYTHTKMQRSVFFPQSS